MLNLVSADDIKTEGKQYYMQLNVRHEIKELHLDVKNFYMKEFFGNFKDRMIDIGNITEKIICLPPSERTIRISILPTIPLFLQGDIHFNLEVSKEQSNIMSDISRLFNTSIDNMGRIVYYQSLPYRLLDEYPYLKMHYKFVIGYLNYYLEVLELDYRFKLL